MRIFQFSNLLFQCKRSFLNAKSIETFRRGLCSKDFEGNYDKKKYKYLLIVDFEATCDNVKIIQEIIEFPCLKINLESGREESRFHMYVRPIINPKLTYFCTELTGIIQDMVDDGETFPDVLKMFEDWRQKEGLTAQNSVYLTSGDWDFGHMIPRQCASSNIEVPSHMIEWIDIKKMYANNFNQFCNSLTDIMKAFNLEFEGRMHSGIDDCLNILKIVRKLIALELNFVPTSKLEITEEGRRVHVYNSRKVNGSKRVFSRKWKAS